MSSCVHAAKISMSVMVSDELLLMMAYSALPAQGRLSDVPKAQYKIRIKAATAWAAIQITTTALLLDFMIGY